MRCRGEFQCFQVAEREIDLVNIIAHACAIRGWIIAAQYIELFSSTDHDLSNKLTIEKNKREHPSCPRVVDRQETVTCPSRSL